MNLAETLVSRGAIASSSVTKADDMVSQHCMAEDELAAIGIANDSFHWELMDIVPPKNTVPVANPGDSLDKKNRKSQKFRKYEAERQLAQDSGPRRTLVQTTAADNSVVMDVTQSSWFV